ncbi:substrate-binding domain-containing protein [Marinobacterium marinum]|uniref:Substrate-binding domain-containing protein n=1 Tax=Marinobacterium marinum TaxID=2756129 RepID=A0A7W2ABM5_9GAMM|nr:substrate-binding domain-containing protein [Marinobacterium marinum]MBA4502200.1 substrate-binding domain-containing protein [Marinobacterium marinum]
MKSTQQRGCPQAGSLVHQLLLAVLLVTSMSTATAAGLGDYWTLDEYYNRHAEQRLWLNELEEAVRGNAVPLVRGVQKRPVKIAQVYPGVQASSYWSDSEQAMVGRLEELGIEYQLETRSTSPNTQLEAQIRQIRELLDWEPDYLIYTLDSPRQKLLVERLMQNTDTRLILQNITTPLKAWEQRQPFMYVGFDHMDGGRLLAEHFARRLPDASYGVLFRSKGLVSQMRGAGFVNAVPAAHRLLSGYYSDSSLDGGRDAALRMLAEHPDLDYIYACSTDVALGALGALQQLERNDVLVNGWGGGPEEIQRLRSGELPVVLMRLSDEAGIAIAEGIGRDLLGLPVPKVFSGRFVVLDDKMTADDIRRYELEAHRYSGRADAQ